MKGVLDGIKVIDCSHQSYQSPLAATMLADLGADVIHVEPPGTGNPLRNVRYLSGVDATLSDGSNVLFQLANRGKRSLTLDIRKEEGRKVLFQLVSKADVFLTSIRPHVLTRLGLEYETLCKHNPLIVYAHASGVGRKGPGSSQHLHDYTGQARSGFMHMIGEPDSPPAVLNVAIGDVAGAIMLAYGVLAAIVARERYGIGQEVDAAQLGAMIFLQQTGLGQYLMVGKEPPRVSQQNPPSPLWNHYQCKDNKWIVLGIFNADKYWPSLCGALGIEHLETHPHFDSQRRRRENRQELCSVLREVFATRDSDEWLKALEELDVPASRVNDYSDVASDPDVIDSEYIVEFDDANLGKIRTIGYPVFLGKTPLKIRSMAPQLGQHSEEVLLEAGYNMDEISDLRNSGVV